MIFIRRLGIFTASLVLIASFAAPAKATLLLDSGGFDIEFVQTSPGSDSFSGMFTAENGVVTSFMAAVGNCAIAADCEYNVIGGLLWDGYVLSSGAAFITGGSFTNGFLDFDDPGIWLTFNSFDTVNRNGTYSVSLKIPEPATMSLFAIGLVGLGVMTRRRRKSWSWAAPFERHRTCLATVFQDRRFRFRISAYMRWLMSRRFN